MTVWFKVPVTSLNRHLFWENEEGYDYCVLKLSYIMVHYCNCHLPRSSLNGSKKASESPTALFCWRRFCLNNFVRRRLPKCGGGGDIFHATGIVFASEERRDALTHCNQHRHLSDHKVNITWITISMLEAQLSSIHPTQPRIHLWRMAFRKLTYRSIAASEAAAAVAMTGE